MPLLDGGHLRQLPDTAEKRAEECSLPVKIDRREDGTVSVGTQSLVPWETDYGKLEIMADVYLNYLAQVFNLPDDDYVKTRLEFGSDSADRDSLMTPRRRKSSAQTNKFTIKETINERSITAQMR